MQCCSPAWVLFFLVVDETCCLSGGCLAVVGGVTFRNEVEVNPKSSFIVLGTDLGWSVSRGSAVTDAARL